MQARCNVVALRSWWMLTRLHCAKLQAAAGAPAKESDSSERVLEKLPRCVRPLRPSIHPSNHPSLPLCRLPARLFVRSVSFAPRTPLDLVLCNARAVPFLTSSPSLFLSPTPLFTADSIPRARSPLARARARISSSPLCALLPLSPSADHHRHERRRFNLESTAKLLREQDMVTGKVEKEEGEGEAVEG